MCPVKNSKKGFVLASVFDKKDIAKFVKFLKTTGYSIIATEGTSKELIKEKISFYSAEQISRNPKKLEDCIKTISFRIEAGILFNRSNKTQVKEVKSLGIKPIDIVICNFPPLEKVVKKTRDFNVRNIDVGGPLMVRAAATNFKNVLIVVDPNDYKKIEEAIIEKNVTAKLHQRLAKKAFRYTCDYDQKIARYLRENDL